MEYQMAISERDAEVKRSELLKSNLDTSRVVSKQHADAEEAWPLIHYTQRSQWENTESQLEKSLAEKGGELSECKALLSKAQDAVKVKSAINSQVADQQRKTAVRLPERRAELENEAETLRRQQQQPSSSPVSGSNYLDGSLPEGAIRQWQVDALRVSRKSEKEEVEKANGERDELVSANISEFMTCLNLSQRLTEGQEVIEELRESLIQEAKETRTARSEAFDLLDNQERSRELIAELQEKNRALTARGAELHRRIGERQDCPPEHGQTLFRRARPGETPVARETVTYQRSRSRQAQLAEDARASADEAMRMSASQGAANRVTRFQTSRNRAVNADPIRDPW